ncbi:MAG: AMP-binding protein [Alphaproteobacteria bacterium]|nr:AMP-binding protein [Alphaproteobacteria bacterium]
MRIPGGVPSAHQDRFARDRLPPAQLLPRFDYSAPFLSTIPDRLNGASLLIDGAIAEGFSQKPAFFCGDAVWSYGELQDKADRIARVLVEDFGLIPGNRVLVRSANTPMAAACWLGILKAGGVCVNTMALLRARELIFILNKAQINIALADIDLAEELELAKGSAEALTHVCHFSSLFTGKGELDQRMAKKDGGFRAVDTAADDVALITFTSGTTGNPKGALHLHRDILAVCRCWPQVYTLDQDDIVAGSPSLAFTYGMAAFLMYPLYWRASAALLPKPTPDAILETIERRKVTSLYTVPTMYHALLEQAGGRDLASLRKCTSAGEHLRQRLWDGWLDKTGIRLVNGLGMTEFLTHFISESMNVEKPGSTGCAVPGYTVAVLDDAGNPLPPGSKGRLAAFGPTGGRYMDDAERQAKFVQNGWNVTGDIAEQDADGWFWYTDRSDDMIVTSGYNVSATEVERVILDHPKVYECAVVGVDDEARGRIVRACIVLKDMRDASETTAKEIQEYVKATIAPYKYPRDIKFIEELPKTLTGKIQRYRLRTL